MHLASPVLRAVIRRGSCPEPDLDIVIGAVRQSSHCHVETVQPYGNLFEVIVALQPPHAPRAACTAGNNVIKIPTIVITTRSSAEETPAIENGPVIGA